MTATSANNPSSPKSARATCPAGTVLTGGGYSTSLLSSDLSLRESTPVGTRSWEVNVIEQPYFGNYSWSVSAHAICATKAG